MGEPRDTVRAWLASLYRAAQDGCCGIYEGEGSDPCPDCLTDEILSAPGVEVMTLARPSLTTDPDGRRIFGSMTDLDVVIRLPVQPIGEGT